jgi:hypothetical protein
VFLAFVTKFAREHKILFKNRRRALSHREGQPLQAPLFLSEAAFLLSAGQTEWAGSCDQADSCQNNAKQGSTSHSSKKRPGPPVAPPHVHFVHAVHALRQNTVNYGGLRN